MAKEQWAQCPCGKGVQDGVHFFEECALMAPARAAVVEEVREALQREGMVQDMAVWAGLARLGGGGLAAMLGPRESLSPAGEVVARSAAAKVWVREAKVVSEQYMGGLDDAAAG